MGDQRETVLSSRVGWAGSFLRVRVDDVQLPSGRETVREYVDHPGAVAVLALTEDDEVVMIRQFRSPVGETLLEIPAGTREPGEDAEATARRELIEETGYEAAGLVEIARYFSSPGYTNEEIDIFYAQGCVPIDADAGEEETIDLVLVPIVELPRLMTDRRHDVRDGIALIALQWLLLRHALPGDSPQCSGWR